MKTGQGRARARVLVADGRAVVLEAETGPDGVSAARLGAAARIEPPPDLPGSRRRPRGRLGPGRARQGVAGAHRPRLHLHRPARLSARPAGRRPGRGPRGRRAASTPTLAEAGYRFEVADSRGRLIVARPVTLSDFGTFHETLPLDRGAPVGTYRVRVYQPGKSDFAGRSRSSRTSSSRST